MLIQCCWMQTGALKGYWKVKRPFAWMQRNLENIQEPVEQNHILEFGARKDSTLYIFLLNLQLAFLATRETEPMEELTWVKSPSIFIKCFVQERHLGPQDYGIQFDDNDHPFETFKCRCGSMRCHDKKSKENIMKISELK
ncbi:hypothetical protein NC651_000938 [Populus alba x Populus x berolinensis]|nr:hypothetical protein NC651_000938 [Populus alba x Populus x berolinensis]